MKNSYPKLSRFKKAQTVTELAIFGAIVVFLIGVMVRQSINSNFNQNQALKAMRMALRESFTAAEAGNASRNVASIVFVEDRKAAEVNKYGTVTRVPYILTGTGSYTKNLFMPTDFGNIANLPVTDMFINGQHFTFTTAGFRTVAISADQDVYKVVANIPGSTEYSPGCGDDCFDLDCDGSPDVPAGQRATFSWQWKPFKPNSDNIDVGEGRNNVADFDHDCKEETALKIGGGGYNGADDINDVKPWRPHPGPDNDPPPENVSYIQVIDSQAGDIDPTYNTNDKLAGRPRPGLTQRQTLYTFTQDGTFLAIGEFGGQNASWQQQNKIDLIERQIQLSNNTGRMCNGSNPAVQVCGNCFSAANINKTCFQAGENILYVRTAFEDVGGQIWATDF